jgi:hypothetical protein
MVSKNFTRQYYFDVKSMPWAPIEEWLDENKIRFTLSYSMLSIKKKKHAVLFTLRWGIEGKCIRLYEHEADEYKVAIWTTSIKT